LTGPPQSQEDNLHDLLRNRLKDKFPALGTHKPMITDQISHVGGTEGIHESHFIGAAYGMERMMGHTDTPVQRSFNYASENFARHLSIVYVLTVVGLNTEGELQSYGLFIGDEFIVLAPAVVEFGEVRFDYL